jgi:hypothetical protein
MEGAEKKRIMKEISEIRTMLLHLNGTEEEDCNGLTMLKGKTGVRTLFLF